MDLPLGIVIFLALVESPHIERTYNSPPPLKRTEEAPTIEQSEDKSKHLSNGEVNEYQPLASATRPSPVHTLIGLQNIDLHRVTDVSVILLQMFMYIVAFLTPATFTWQAFFVASAPHT